MKINFWQVLGVLLILGGIAGVIYEKYYAGKSSDSSETTPKTDVPPLTTQPATN